MELKDTVDLMLSDDWKDRLKADVMIKKLIGQVEITGFPEPKPYDTHDYDDIMPGPYNGDFLEEDR